MGQFEPVPSHQGAPRRAEHAACASGRADSEFQRPTSRNIGPGKTRVSKLVGPKGKKGLTVGAAAPERNVRLQQAIEQEEERAKSYRMLPYSSE